MAPAMAWTSYLALGNSKNVDAKSRYLDSLVLYSLWSFDALAIDL